MKPNEYHVKQAEFVGTAANREGFPKDGLPHIAVFGRSNVGKSSLLNALMQRKNLVKTSSTPGKTQLLQFFRVNHAFHFVDVPGFGYAKVGGETRRSMEAVIRDYVKHEKACAGLLYLVDSRLVDSPVDRDAIAWLEAAELPLLVIATKTDKLTRQDIPKAMAAIRKEHGLQAEPLPVSSAKKTGLQAVWEQIDLLLHGHPGSQELT
jgi:GTP-binding protein